MGCRHVAVLFAGSEEGGRDVGQLWFTDGYVYGGRPSIVSTFFGDAPAPMFEQPPKCWMHKQGNFITGFFPPEAVAGADYGFFYLPPIDDAYGKPFLVAGDIMAMFNDRPEVRALMEYFTTPQSASGWLETGGALAAHKTATPDMYGVDLERGIAELVSQATSFRFDGFGPDAGRGRRRLVLERHDRLGVGRCRSGHRPGRDRRLLARRC